MVRRATPADHGWIQYVGTEVYRTLGDYGRILPSWLDHPGVLTYVDQDEVGALRGFLLLGFYQPADAGGRWVADLLAIAVAPAHQRRGLGKELLAHALEVARSAGRASDVREIRLTVAENNTVGQRLYTRTGFSVVDEDHGSYDGGQRAIRMARYL